MRGRPPSTVVPLLVLLLLGGCGGEGGGDAAGEAAPPLLVLAASGLRDALEALVPLYEARTGTEVDLVLGSSGNLSTQILNGAPADVFIAADGGFVDPLEAAGLVVEGSRRIVGVGRVALVWREGLTAPEGVEALGEQGGAPVSIANPELAPYGAAAREILQAAGLLSTVEPHIVMGENVSQALQFVESGNADYGLVALSLVRGTRPRVHLVLPDGLHRPLAQVGVALRSGPRSEEGELFVDFLLSAEGQGVLDRFGFQAPDP